MRQFLDERTQRPLFLVFFEFLPEKYFLICDSSSQFYNLVDLESVLSTKNRVAQFLYYF